MANVFWDVDFDWTADNMGVINIQLKFKMTDGSITPWIPVGQQQVFKGWTNERKARETAARIRANFGDSLEIKYPGNGDDEFKIKVRPNPITLKDIVEIHDFHKVDINTGEGITGVKDAPEKKESPAIGFGYLYLTGTGASPNGVVQLQLSKKQPLVEVKSFERSAAEIMEELAARFNEGYDPLGFRAQSNVPDLGLGFEEMPCLSVPEVPCPLGFRAGSRDFGFVSWMGYSLY